MQFRIIDVLTTGRVLVPARWAALIAMAANTPAEWPKIMNWAPCERLHTPRGRRTSTLARASWSPPLASEGAMIRASGSRIRHVHSAFPRRVRVRVVHARPVHACRFTQCESKPIPMDRVPSGRLPTSPWRNTSIPTIRRASRTYS